VSNLHVYAAMRGQSLGDLLKTRNTQVLYSVSGKKDEAAQAQPPAEAAR
jgi:gallate dioxygenase